MSDLFVFVLAAVLALGAACNNRAATEPDDKRPARTPDAASRYPVTIHAPVALESIETGTTDPTGRAIRIRCESCHTLQGLVTEPPVQPSDAKGPHVGLEFAHGTLQCVACHLPNKPSDARLATGESIPMTQAMQLCRQCHGTHARDYDYGAHGGMQGYWDLSRGPRVRNNCVDCHDPHRPKFEQFQPMPPPRDRFKPASKENSSHE